MPVQLTKRLICVIFSPSVFRRTQTGGQRLEFLFGRRLVIMDNYKYKMSFTTGGLFLNESLKAAALYSRIGDWKGVRAEIIAGNILQANRASTLARVSLEVCSRLKTLDGREIEYMLNAGDAEQRLILWLAVCRCYRFIGEFAVEVVRERFLSMRRCLAAEDFDAFFNSKAQWNDNLEKIKPATRAKLRQVFFKIMREAGLLSDSSEIAPPIFSRELTGLFRERRPADISFFPTYEKPGAAMNGGEA